MVDNVACGEKKTPQPMSLMFNLKNQFSKLINPLIKKHDSL